MGRQYTLMRRAELVDETRRRITDAAVELHGTLGPARTTISAVAERAGVQRLTVYRHFPDETALFHACTIQWLADNPPPDPRRWAAHRDPHVRFRRALQDMYGYFDRTRAMWERAYRDAPSVPALEKPMTAWFDYLRGARDVLVRGWPARGRRRQRLEIAIGHALAFPTWASLTGLGCDTTTAVGLMADLAEAAAQHAGPAAPGRRGRRPPS